MFIGDPPGNTDRILDFSKAITGGLFFVPSAELLENLIPGGETSDSASAEAPADEPTDQSLRIGSLRPSG
jgi:putative iron-dependent peroxidase